MAVFGKRPRRNLKPIPKKENPHRINNLITGEKVRLVGDNVEVGIYPLRTALNMAVNMELDLVELSVQEGFPLCRIMNYSKFLYEKKRKEKELKAKSKSIEVKEIRFTAETDEHDFNFKAKHAENFLKEGNKVKAFVLFRGRAINFKERGELLLLKLAEILSEVGQLEGMPKMEGKKMLSFFVPKKKK